MNDPLQLNGKRVTVFGLGNTGLSLARYAYARGARVRVVDSRESPPNGAQLHENVPTAQLICAPFSPQHTDDADLVLLSPGVSVYESAVRAAARRGVEIAGDIEVFARHIPKTTHVIGITGSNGKTTTTALVGALCAATGMATLVAGNIGATVLDELSVIEQNHAWPSAIVLELSSFQLESTRSLPCASASVLNVSEDHLDRYASYFEYIATKATLYEQTKLQVINRDDAFVVSMRRKNRDFSTFGDGPAHAGDFGRVDGYLVCGDKKLIAVDALRLAGGHNHMNALAALALVAPICGLGEPVLTALQSFEGLPHRMVRVATVGGVAYIDDSKATNVGAAVAGLNGLTATAVLIAGGDGKGQDFAPLRNAVANHARAVVLIGRDASQIAAVLEGLAIPVVHAPTLERAVVEARELAHTGDVVLLSPACASLDMFRNYGHRSEVFVQAVRALSNA